MTKKEQEPRCKATHEGRLLIASQKRYLGQKIFVTLSKQLLSHKKNYYRIKRTEWRMWSSLWIPLSPRRQREKFSWKEEEKGKRVPFWYYCHHPRRRKFEEALSKRTSCNNRKCLYLHCPMWQLLTAMWLQNTCSVTIDCLNFFHFN